MPLYCDQILKIKIKYGYLVFMYLKSFTNKIDDLF